MGQCVWGSGCSEHVVGWRAVRGRGTVQNAGEEWSRFCFDTEFIFFAAAHCCCLPSITNFRAQPPRASDYLLRLSGSHPCPQQQSRTSEASRLMTRGYHSLSLSSVTSATVGLPRPYGVSHSNKSPFYPYYFYQLCSARELELIQ